MRFPRTGGQQYLSRAAPARSARRTGQRLRSRVASAGDRDLFGHPSFSASNLPLAASRFGRAVDAGRISEEFRNAFALDAHFEFGLPSGRFCRSRCRHSRLLRKSLRAVTSWIKLEGSVRNSFFLRNPTKNPLRLLAGCSEAPESDELPQFPVTARRNLKVSETAAWLPLRDAPSRADRRRAHDRTKGSHDRI